MNKKEAYKKFPIGQRILRKRHDGDWVSGSVTGHEEFRIEVEYDGGASIGVIPFANLVDSEIRVYNSSEDYTRAIQEDNLADRRIAWGVVLSDEYIADAYQGMPSDHRRKFDTFVNNALTKLFTKHYVNSHNRAGTLVIRCIHIHNIFRKLVQS